MLKSIMNYNRGKRFAALRKKNDKEVNEVEVISLSDAIKAIGTFPEEVAATFSQVIIFSLNVECKNSVEQFVNSVANTAREMKKAA